MISVYPWGKNLLSVRYHLAFAGHGSAHLISERAPLEEADRPYFCPHGEREHVWHYSVSLCSTGLIVENQKRRQISQTDRHVGSDSKTM